MYTLEAFSSFYTNKNEDVEERERLHWVLEGNQCYKIWRSLLISFILELMIFGVRLMSSRAHWLFSLSAALFSALSVGKNTERGV